MDANRRVPPRVSGAAIPVAPTAAPLKPPGAPPQAPWAILPNILLLPKVSPLARQCAERGLGTFHAVSERVYRLPYGRVANPARFESVLEEGRGTCSTKHALLSTLAQEHGVELPLMLGIYEMDAANTPAAAPVLDAAGLPRLPEAHCYLAWGKARVDLTHSDPTPADRHFLLEERIQPQDIVDYKPRRHREFLDGWLRQAGMARHWTLDGLWTVRERCIAALAAPAPV